MRRSPVSLLFLLLALLTACARGSSAGSDDRLGTIRGEVVLAPVCPVESIQRPCPGRELAGVQVHVVDEDGQVRASGVSDHRGAFTIDVAPGAYLLTAVIEGDPARSVEPVRVEVRAGEVVRSDVMVDSGIR